MRAAVERIKFPGEMKILNLKNFWFDSHDKRENFRWWQKVIGPWRDQKML